MDKERDFKARTRTKSVSQATYPFTDSLVPSPSAEPTQRHPRLTGPREGGGATAAGGGQAEAESGLAWLAGWGSSSTPVKALAAGRARASGSLGIGPT